MRLVDILYPEYCVHCKRDLSEGWRVGRNGLQKVYKEAPFLRYLCLDCFMRVRLRKLVCPTCGEKSPTGAPCKKKCKKSGNLDRLIFIDYYANPVLKSAIKAFKFWGVRKLEVSLAEMMSFRLHEDGWLETLHKQQAALSFIPLSVRKKRQRGFNQAELLADNMGAEAGLSVISLLKKKSGLVMPQSKFGERGNSARRKRFDNIADTFLFQPERTDLFHTVVLIDDVYTSGATLHEASRVIKEHMDTEVWGLVAAKA